jgi:hypothetical protein
LLVLEVQNAERRICTPKEAAMRSLLIRAAGLIVLAVVLSAAGHHHLKQQIFIYDTGTRAYVPGAIVTVTYDGGAQSAETEAPHGYVMFVLPGELDAVDVHVTADGYLDYTGTLLLTHRPHVGGRGFWIGLTAEP